MNNKIKGRGRKGNQRKKKKRSHVVFDARGGEVENTSEILEKSDRSASMRHGEKGKDLREINEKKR